MESNELLNKYIKKLKTESIIKSCILAAAVAFLASFITSFAIWFTSFKGWWVSIIVFAVVMAAITPLVYFKKYMPTVKDTARRLDRLGLEERVITMTELEGVDSVMASHQRASTKAALGTVTAGMLKIAVSGLSIAALAVSCVFGAGMTTVDALSKTNKLPTGGDIIDNLDPEPDVYYVLRYEVCYLDGNGLVTEGDNTVEIIGNDEQLVLAGTDAEPVSVYIDDDYGEDAEYGWQFLGWYNTTDFSVEVEEITFDLELQDLAVDTNINGIIVQEDDENVITRYAVVLQIPLDPPDGDGDSEPDDSEDQEQDDSEDKPDDSKPDDSNGDSDDNEDPGDGSGAGKYEGGNQIIDGNEYYRDHFDDYMREYQEYLEKGGEIPDYLKKFIETYYNIIK